MRAGGGVRGGGADVPAHQFRRNHQPGPALDGLPFQGVVAVRGPDPVGPFQDAEIDAGAAGGAAFNLDAGMGRLERVEEPVRGEGLFVHRGAAGVAVLQQVPVLVPLEVADVVLAQQRIHAVVDVLPGVRVDEVNDVLVAPLPAAAARRPCSSGDGPDDPSGCARTTSESRLTISGSTHSPNSIPREVTASISGVSPEGQRASSTYQSPRPAWSSRRPRNQPSSSTKRSTPSSAAESASSIRVIEVVVEVHRFPGVEHHRAGLCRNRAPARGAAGPEPGVEGLADAVQAAV